MEKAPGARPFPGFSFFAHMLFSGLSPDSVDNGVTSFVKGESARRSRTTERSESVSEEAEKRLDVHFLLTHLCGIHCEKFSQWCEFFLSGAYGKANERDQNPHGRD